MCDDARDGEGVILGTDQAGVPILTPCGPLEEDSSPALLRIATTAVSLGTRAVTVDLRQVASYNAAGVHAVRCCRALAVSSNTSIRFLTGGQVSQQLLLESYLDEQLPSTG